MISAMDKFLEFAEENAVPFEELDDGTYRRIET